MLFTTTVGYAMLAVAAKRRVRIDELPGDPVADREAYDEPNHRQNDTGLAGVAIILGEPLIGGLGAKQSLPIRKIMRNPARKISAPRMPIGSSRPAKPSDNPQISTARLIRIALRRSFRVNWAII